MKKIITTLIFITIFSLPVYLFGQDGNVNVDQMTKEDVLELNYDQLLEMPLADLLKLADIVGVSLDELYEMILNKDVVSASKKVESSFEAPLSTSVVSYDEIVASGARTIEEALRLVPGMIIREKTTGNFDAHIRGNDNLPPNHMLLYSENSNTLVMINNRPIFNYVHGGTFWETLPIGIEDIDRIEVVRGPSCALYGPNAVSGVVNIITKNTESDTPLVNVNAEMGNLNSQIASLRVHKQLNNKLSMAVTGNYMHFNRSTDQLYVYKLGEYVSKEVLDTISDPSNTAYKIYDPTDSMNLMFPDPAQARQNYGANAYLTYNLSDMSSIALSCGYQNSDIISSTMGDNPTPTVGRLSSTYYADARIQVKNFRLQANYLDGWQDIVREDTGFKIDAQNINVNAEYDFNFNGLNIRPGVAYQQAIYNDQPFLHENTQGFLNGKSELQSLAFSLRFDYTLFERLRLIAAIRGEKFNTNDNPYLSYQFIGSYNLNDMHNIRAVYSRANRSPFLVDTYANYLWERTGRPSPAYMFFKGSQSLDLLTMDMLELGYRVKPNKKLQIDAEAFYTKTNNFSALYPDSASVLNGPAQIYVQLAYQNIDLEAQQAGITITGSYVVNQDFVLKAFTTIQQTRVKHVIQKPLEDVVFDWISDAATSGVGYSTSNKTITSDEIHRATPLVYGGFIANYTYNNKLNLNLNTYLLSEQQFNSKYKLEKQDADKNYIGETIALKAIVNAKIAYRINNNTSIHLNARNMVQNQVEYGYLDKVGMNLLGGISINF